MSQLHSTTEDDAFALGHAEAGRRMDKQAIRQLVDALAALVKHHRGLHAADEFCEDWCEEFKSVHAALRAGRERI